MSNKLECSGEKKLNNERKRENKNLKMWFDMLVQEFKNIKKSDEINILNYYNNLTICYPITEYIYKTILNELEELGILEELIKSKIIKKKNQKKIKKNQKKSKKIKRRCL